MKAIAPAVAEPTLDDTPCAESVDVPSPSLASAIDEPGPDIEGIDADAALPAKTAHIRAVASAAVKTIALSRQLAVVEADGADTRTL
jgi:hypothetical protein